MYLVSAPLPWIPSRRKDRRVRAVQQTEYIRKMSGARTRPCLLSPRPAKRVSLRDDLSQFNLRKKLARI